MAHSVPIRGAQIPVQCQLCEGNTNVKWKCKECELLMCEKCTEKIHPKFKMADTHHVVKIKDVAKNDQDSFQKQNRAKCKIHISQDYCIFCQTCDELVCPSCLTKSHQKHDLQEIEDIFTEDIKSLNSCNDELKNKFLDFYEKQLEKIEQLKVNKMDHLEMVKCKIEKQESKFMSALKSFKQTVLDDLVNKSCDEERVELTAKSTIQHNIVDIREKIDTIQNVVDHKDIENVHKTANNFRKWLLSASEPVSVDLTVFERMTDFFPRPIDKSTVGTLFGHLSVKNETPISLLETFTSNTYTIDRLKVNKGKEVWISDFPTKLLRRIRTNFSCTVSTLQNFSDYQIFDMSLLSTQDLIFTMHNNKNDLYVVIGNVAKSFCSFAPLIPRAVHVSKNGPIYISTRDSATTFEKSDSSIRQIIKLDKDRNQDIVFECTGTSNVITYITRIRDGCDCLYVVDVLSRNLNGRIVSIGKDRTLKWIYNGERDESEYTFVPSDLEVTSSGNIVLCDMCNDALHILAKEGTILHYILLSKLGIYGPCCVEIIQNDKMYIGCRQEETKDTKFSNLYLVSLSEI